jgi:nucleoside-diphosphate-sugar epimerase
MKIFITGSTGLVGSNLVKYYKDDYEVFSYTRGMDLEESLNSFDPDIIIHCAAEIYKPEDMFDSNILMTYKCLEYVKNTKTYVRMVHIGSSSEYGHTDHPSSETTLLKPTDFYSGSKAASTMMCQGWARQFNLPIWIARPYSLYGLGEREHRLFPRLVRAFKHDESMTLYDGYHDFIYIDDFVRGIDNMIFYWDLGFGEVVNFGSGQQVSNFDLLKIFEKVTDKKAPVTKIPELNKKFESKIWVCDTTKANELGFEIEYDLEAGIKQLLKETQ